MTWLKPVTTIIAVLMLTTLVWASQSDEGAAESDAPPAEGLELPPAAEESQEDADFPEDAAEFPADAEDFPADAVEFPGDAELQDLPEPGRRRMNRDDIKGQLFQLLQREISRKMAEKKRRRGARGDVGHALEQQLQDQLRQFDLPRGIDATSQFESYSHGQPFPQTDGVGARVKHLDAAVFHLHAAEMHELAEIVEQQADALRQMARSPHEVEHQPGEHSDREYAEQEFRDHGDQDRRFRGAPDGERRRGDGDQLRQELREMMEQMELLRGEVQELKNQLSTDQDE